MIDAAFAARFAEEWIQAWNSHDLDRVLSHYADTFEMVSPVIVQITGESSGRLIGKPAVRAYWSKAFQLIPDLRFELIATLVGVDSVHGSLQGAPRVGSRGVHFRQWQGREGGRPLRIAPRVLLQ